MHLFKDMVKKACRLSGYAFNRAWGLLFELGYLTKKQRGGREKYLYTSVDCPKGYEEKAKKQREIEEKVFSILAEDVGANCVRPSDPPEMIHIGTGGPRVPGVIPPRNSSPLQYKNRDSILRQIKQNVSYDILAAAAGTPGMRFLVSELNGYVALMTDVVCGEKKEHWINGGPVPIEAVRKRLMEIDSGQLLSVMEKFKDADAEREIKNRRQYKIACLYNETGD